MTIDPVAQALHHKSTLGSVLTPEEQERLNQWYAKMDEEEAALFAKAGQRASADDLQTKIDATMSQIIAEAQTVQALERENERIRAEVDSLQHQIAQKKVPQSA